MLGSERRHGRQTKADGTGLVGDSCGGGAVIADGDVVAVRLGDLAANVALPMVDVLI